jgi:hypothetical protein
VTSQMFKVFTGKEGKIWVLHEELFCERSEFFKKALKSGFKESQTKEIYLEDNDLCDVETFGLFVA